MVTYHATSIPLPSLLKKSLCTALHTFVAANKPVLGGTAAQLHLWKDTCFRAVVDSGIALVDLKSPDPGTPAKGCEQTAGARAAGVGGLLQLLALQERIVASSIGTQQASSSSGSSADFSPSRRLTPKECRPTARTPVRVCPPNVADTVPLRSGQPPIPRDDE